MEVKKKMKKIITLLVLMLIAVSAASVVFATGDVKDLKLAHGIDVNDEGKLIKRKIVFVKRKYVSSRSGHSH